MKAKKAAAIIDWMHRQGAGLERGRQVRAEPGRPGPEERQDQNPKQQRALMVPPDAGDLVDQRLVGMGVRDNKGEREIRPDEGQRQHAERHRRQQKLDGRGGGGQPHPAGPAAACADQRHHRLHEGHQKGEDQREMAKFCGHGSLRRILLLATVVAPAPASSPTPRRSTSCPNAHGRSPCAPDPRRHLCVAPARSGALEIDGKSWACETRSGAPSAVAASGVLCTSIQQWPLAFFNCDHAG
jgi:hypothetical protein